MNRGAIEQTVEMVARAIQEAQPQACLWDVETAPRREHFRQCARNAIRLLDEDIDVLLLVLREATAEQRQVVSQFNPSPGYLAGVTDTSAE
jgi:hypothetical protein